MFGVELHFRFSVDVLSPFVEWVAASTFGLIKLLKNARTLLKMGAILLPTSKWNGPEKLVLSLLWSLPLVEWCLAGTNWNCVDVPTVVVFISSWGPPLCWKYVEPPIVYTGPVFKKRLVFVIGWVAFSDDALPFRYFSIFLVFFLLFFLSKILASSEFVSLYLYLAISYRKFTKII